MKSALSLAFVAIAAAVIGALSYQSLNSQQAHGTAATTLPSFTLKDMHGQTRHSSEWQGKTRLLNFWATWCPPCRKEIPLLMAAQEQHAENGLQIIGIALEQAETVRQYAEEIGINYPSLVGNVDVIELGNALGNHIGALPFSVLIDAQGNVLESHMGELSQAQLTKLLSLSQL